MDATQSPFIQTEALQPIEADAFRRVYPEIYLKRFLESSVRPDGRLLGEERQVTINHGVVSSCNASSMIRIGSTTALAGIQCEVVIPPEEEPQNGELLVNVELPAMCSPHIAPGRVSEDCHYLSSHLDSVLRSCIDLQQLCISPGRAAWALYVDVYFLDLDGALIDACFLSSVNALSQLRLPRVAVDDNGNVMKSEFDEKSSGLTEAKIFRLACLPFASTCAVLDDGTLLVDPTADEESIIGSLITIVIDEAGNILKTLKFGGTRTLHSEQVRGCLEVAKKRVDEVRPLMDKLDEASI